MGDFDAVYEHWLAEQIAEESNPRRRDMLQKGLGHATVEFLRMIWYPVIGNLDHLYPEWEIRDISNRYRYLDLAFLPGGAKGCIEIHGYRSHARDIEAWRFKDLCMKQALLTLDNWIFLPIAYLSIKEDPELCRQLILSFAGKLLSMPNANTELDCMEEEALRFARRLLRPFTAHELAAHLKRTDRHARRILDKLVEMDLLVILGGKQRYRCYQLTTLAGGSQRHYGE